MIGAALAACDRPQAPASSAQPPLVQKTVRTPQRVDAISGELTAAGIPATYQAFFSAVGSDGDGDGEQLTRITETRMASDDAQGVADYEFKGARLLKYSGASPSGGSRIELVFDLQGALVSSHGTSGDVAQEEISAIRTRAQTLRSHALARRASQTHAGH